MEHFTDENEFARFNSGTNESEDSSGDVAEVGEEIESLDMQPMLQLGGSVPCGEQQCLVSSQKEQGCPMARTLTCPLMFSGELWNFQGKHSQ